MLIINLSWFFWFSYFIFTSSFSNFFFRLFLVLRQSIFGYRMNIWAKRFFRWTFWEVFWFICNSPFILPNSIFFILVIIRWQLLYMIYFQRFIKNINIISRHTLIYLPWLNFWIEITENIVLIVFWSIYFLNIALSSVVSGDKWEADWRYSGSRIWNRRFLIFRAVITALKFLSIYLNILGLLA